MRRRSEAAPPRPADASGGEAGEVGAPPTQKRAHDPAPALERAIADDLAAPPPPKVVGGREMVVPVDPVNERAVLAAAVVDEGARAALLRKVRADHFLVKRHATLWAALERLHRAGVEPSPSALARETGVAVEEVGVVLDGAAPGRAADYHVQALLWDKQRTLAAEGPLRDLLEKLRDPRAEPERVRAHARRLAEALSGTGSGRFLFDSRELARSHAAEIRERAAGRRHYPYGIPGLDYTEDGARRLLMGAAPGKVTVVTGLSGSGKSTLAVHLALGLARQRRRVLFGAWEPGEGMTLELAACISLGWSRSAVLAGALTEEELQTFEQRMAQIGEWVTFMDNPFFRRDRGEKASNERNLDLVEEHIATARADVFIADLWERCLESDKPEDEKRALFRQQAMVKELGAHAILLAQQRKDVEQRADKRPTREGIKGSGAWFEVADTLLGTHRPALWKKVDDVVLEVPILKQRWGPWPLCVEFAWDADRGALAGGRSVAYEHTGETSELDTAGFQAKPFHVRSDRGKRGRS